MATATRAQRAPESGKRPARSRLTGTKERPILTKKEGEFAVTLKHPPIADPTLACSDCHLSRLCLPSGLPAPERSALNPLVRRNRTLPRGQSLYQTGEGFSGLYALKSGAAKLVHLDACGQESVIALLLPGELMGFDGLASGRHRCDLIAVEASTYCELPAAELEALGHQRPTVQEVLLKRTGEQFDRAIEQLAASHRPAEERLAGFLLDLVERLRRRGLAFERFKLNLSRQDIGNHLGLALETVSRTLGRFETLGLLNVKGKGVEILDLDALREAAGEARRH